MERPFYIIGNWKSNKTVAEALSYFSEFARLLGEKSLDLKNRHVILSVPALHLYPLQQELSKLQLPLSLASQDISQFESGAYTGAISAQMLSGVVSYTLIGHSERRKYFSETDEILAKKVMQAKQHMIEPIFCIQSPDTPIPAGVTFVGYEPVWAIGTGKPETPENANDVAQKLKAVDPSRIVIYGGSVTAQNVATFAAQPQLDGVLPGGASLDPNTFVELISHAT